jgi:hypothetical protein
MKRLFKAPFAVVTLVLGLSISVKAQESQLSTGGDASGTGGSVAYSVGQVVYTTNTSTTGSVAQGVQHAYEILSFGSDEFAFSINLNAFPNPTTDYLTLEIIEFDKEAFVYQLTDMRGKHLAMASITAQQTKLDMTNYPPAIYFLTVINQNNQVVHSFKILKD